MPFLILKRYINKNIVSGTISSILINTLTCPSDDKFSALALSDIILNFLNKHSKKMEQVLKGST